MKTSSQENEINKSSFTPNTNTCVSDTNPINVHELESCCTQQKPELGQTKPNKVSHESSLEKSSFKNHAQPYPFTFLTAVKCKLPIGNSHASQNKVVKTAEPKNAYSMHSVEPLSLPNVKIAPKVGYVFERNSSSQNKSLTSKKTNGKYETKLDNTHEASTECSSSTTTLKSRNVELLKAPKLSKEKTHIENSARDNFRDKENRFKRIQKTDVKPGKNSSDSVGKSDRYHSYTSKKDIFDKTSNKNVRNDAILNRGFKDNGNTVKKPAKSNRDKSVSKFSTTRLCEKVKPNTCLKSKLVVDKDHVSNQFSSQSNILQQTNDASEDPSFKSALLEQNNSNSIVSTEIMSQDYSSNEDKSTKFNEDCVMANIEKYQKQALTTPPLSLSTPKEKMLINIQRDSPTILSTNDTNQSSNNSIIETKLSQDSLSEKLMDPLKISFRDDSYSNQPEFNDLVTPDFNLTIRSKRRKQFIQYVDSDEDYKDSKLSRKDQTSVQRTTEVQQATTESNTSDQLGHTQKQTHSIESNSRDKTNSSTTWEKNSDINTESKLSNAGSNEKQTRNSSTSQVEDNPSHQTDDTVIKTETISYKADSSLVYSKKYTDPKESLHISLDSGGGAEDASKSDEFSLSKKMRTMSEISLHTTTSSIRTETGTEISISLRDVTCSFNKNLDQEMAQLIDDERQRYNKIEMLFKSREKTLNDCTRKLVKLEEQKKVLRDTGQDSRISSVKKKQRALLLKLQQEKDEMNRLKELHKIASQERKLMLQKQRDMFNPDMSTKNILHKLKRSADSQSPRRLSGPMKGYDIRSNSSMSSLIDSDKSQFDRSKFDCTLNMSADGVLPQQENKNHLKLGIDRFPSKSTRCVESHDKVAQMKYDLKNFDERMRRKSDVKYQLYDIESVLGNGAIELLQDDNHVSLSRSKDQNFIFENVRQKSALIEKNALIEEFTEIWKSHFSQSKSDGSAVDEPSAVRNEKLEGALSEKLEINVDSKNAKRKGLKWHKSKQATLANTADLRYHKKETMCHASTTSSEAIDKKEFRRKYRDNRELDAFLTNTKQISVQELIKHSDLLNERNEELLKDIVDERQNFIKQSSEMLLSSRGKELKTAAAAAAAATAEEEEEKDEDIIEKSDNVSVQSHVSLAISHQSSNDSDKSYLKSVVIRSQKDYQPNSSFQTSKKLEQILKAREATLISRRNCVEEWIAWHARLRDEEERVSRMEKAAYKLVSATARTLSLNDTAISSDNSDVEGRIEHLTKKLSDRRFEMTRLKKEARKQAKRRLRALEANLLTQIKRYDSTISDMRKKIETKKGPNREGSRLEIESKSVDDFIVPDIPIKKIQEIYRRSDLLRSQPDCDVNKNSEERDVSNGGIEPTSSRLESSHPEKIRLKKDINLSGEDCNSVASNANSSTSRSQSNIQKSSKSDVNSKHISRGSSISEESPSKVPSIQLEKYANGNSVTEDKLTHDSEDGSPLILSSKLSYIQLHNKELSDDIHNLENDLRELSELMLNFSKKSSNQNSMSTDSSHQTLKAVDESRSKDTLEQHEKSRLDAESNTIDIDLQTRVKETLSNGILDTDNISTSIEELYSAIKSKDDRVNQHSSVPESFRKSIGTEELPTISHSPRVMNEQDYKSDTCSIVEIISTTVEREDDESTINEINHQTHTSPKLRSNASQESHLEIKDDDNNISIHESQSQHGDNNHSSSIKTASRDDTNQFGSRWKRESSQSQKEPVKNEIGVLASTNAAGLDNVSTELDSFHDKSDDNEKLEKSIERQTQDVQIVQDYDRNSMSDVEDSTIFVPKGESTNLHETFALKLDDNSSDIGMGICSEEFNDILEIIERETKNDDRPENSYQEMNLFAEMNEADVYTPTVNNNVRNETQLDEANASIHESKESEKILDIANRDSDSPATDHETTNKSDQYAPTAVQLNSIVKLDEVSERAQVQEKQDDSSEGEQKNNLIEVAESKLETLQKPIISKENKLHKTHVTVFLDKTLQVIKDPEYEDISEESLEVSDIFNNTNQALHKKSKILATVPEKYIIKSESNEVLRILDEISNKSSKFDRDQQEIISDDIKESPVDVHLSSNEAVSPLPGKQSSLEKQNNLSEEISQELLEEIASSKSDGIEEDTKQQVHATFENFRSSNDDKKRSGLELSVNPILEINQDSGLEIDAFKATPIINKALLSDGKAQDATTEFRTTAMGVSSEKDIETMIKKLKASLEQPGLEVAELEAKLLEIENLQIELAIKKLEAEEVAYYVREIPNKPPPPYTPPGSVRQSGPNSVSSSFAIIPTNIEELTYVTEKATAIIHVKKTSGEDIQGLEAPDDIYENVKDLSSDAVKKNRQIYNTFLFDLCKELIVDVYKVEEENPGPSWTKPKVKTKCVIKIPKSANELNDYVSKEVATLFGFKTKLQRENMVMRWSRKRRDRVDELLAKEAQAEENEWTKFHHDELAVKNELTVTILNNILMETTSCIKDAYAKKRKTSVL